MASKPKPSHVLVILVTIATLAYGAFEVWHYEVAMEDPITAMQARAEVRQREILDMDEAAFDQFLKSLDLEDLATDEEAWRDHTPDSVAKIVKMMAFHGAVDAPAEAVLLLNTFEFDSYAAIQLSQVITAQHGINDMDSYMETRYAKEIKREFPFEKGDELFRTWVSVSCLDGQVRNGGFPQYFANDCGYQLIDAIAAFERIGEKDVCDILIPIRDAFDAVKPVGDYSAAKLDKIIDNTEPLLNDASGDYYAASEHAYANLNLYLMERLKEERAKDLPRK